MKKNMLAWRTIIEVVSNSCILVNFMIQNVQMELPIELHTNDFERQTFESNTHISCELYFFNRNNFLKHLHIEYDFNSHS